MLTPSPMKPLAILREEALENLALKEMILCFPIGCVNATWIDPHLGVFTTTEAPGQALYVRDWPNVTGLNL